jgi:Na+/H+-dicarboxylate symporter
MSSPETPAEEPKQAGIGCGILGRYPILSVISFAAIGVGIGIGLSEWQPENEDVKENVLKWIGLIGDLFIRALKAVVLPLVFVNVAVSIVDMMMMGRASTVGVKTIALYTLTTFIASTIGLISILSFKGLFEEGEFEGENKAFISLGCTQDGSLLTESEVDGSLMCTRDANATSPYSAFEIIDLTASLATNTGGLADLSMSETIYEGVFMKLVTSNIFYDFVDGNFAAVSVPMPRMCFVPLVY